MSDEQPTKKSPDRRKPPRKSLTEEIKTQIRELYAQGKGFNEIYRESDVTSKRLLNSYCVEMGFSFDRSTTAAATSAALEDLRARQVVMAEKMMSTAEYLHERFHDNYRYWMRDGGEMIEVVLPEIPLREVRDVMTATNEAIVGHLRLFEAAGGDTPETEKSMLVALREQIGEYVKAVDETEDATPKILGEFGETPSILGEDGK